MVRLPVLSLHCQVLELLESFVRAVFRAQRHHWLKPMPELKYDPGAVAHEHWMNMFEAAIWFAARKWLSWTSAATAVAAMTTNVPICARVDQASSVIRVALAQRKIWARPSWDNPRPKFSPTSSN